MKWRTDLNKEETLKYKKSKVLHIGMYQLPYKVTNVLCSDGIQRQARVTSPHDPDVWSLLTSVQVKGKTVSGFVTWDAQKEVHIFHAYTHRKNGHLLP